MKRELDVREWLRLAEADRRVAKLLLQDGEAAAYAFHCQQAVEKLLKAIIVNRTGQLPPYVHDLRPLLRSISELGTDEKLVTAVGYLNAYYAATRYPVDTVDAESFTAPLAASAVDQMEFVFQWYSTRMNFGSK